MRCFVGRGWVGLGRVGLDRIGLDWIVSNRSILNTDQGLIRFFSLHYRYPISSHRSPQLTEVDTQFKPRFTPVTTDSVNKNSFIIVSSTIVEFPSRS